MSIVYEIKLSDLPTVGRKVFIAVRITSSVTVDKKSFDTLTGCLSARFVLPHQISLGSIFGPPGSPSCCQKLVTGTNFKTARQGTYGPPQKSIKQPKWCVKRVTKRG